MLNIASFDIDGVLYLGPDIPSIRPNKDDVIITGRSYEERNETLAMLQKYGKLYSDTQVFFNPLKYALKTRESSGLHKSNTINEFNRISRHKNIIIHYEDDEVQAAVISKNCPGIILVMINHTLTDKENVRHTTY